MASEPMSAGDAQGLAERLWRQIEMRRHSSGTSNKPGRENGIRGMLNYYRGEHNLRFASPQFADHFHERFAGFSDNWCATVVDATAERLNFVGIRLGKETQAADTEFQRVFDANEGARGTSEVFTVALAASRSFAMVWGNPDDEDTPLITWEHPEFCAVAVDPETRRVTAAAKGWYEDENNGALTLYTADWVYKWAWSVVNDRDARREVLWRPRESNTEVWPLPNPMGRVPMVEFRNQTLLDDKPISDIAGVAAMQDAVNLVWAYLFNGLDYTSLPQRVVTGSDVPKVPVLNSDGQVTGHIPLDLKKLREDRLLWLPSETAKTSEWSPAGLDSFISVIDMAVDHISSQSRTPPHYLMGKMSNVAAESLTVAETGLVAKAGQRAQFFTGPLRELHRLVALAQGNSARATAAATGKIVWADPQYRSLAQKIDAAVKLRSIGAPIEWIFEWIGLEPSEVGRVMTMINAEQAAALQRMAAQATLLNKPSDAAPATEPDGGAVATTAPQPAVLPPMFIPPNLA